jgi:PBSX family phage portal protein
MAEQAEGTKVERLPLEVVDDQGNRHNVVLRATIIEPKSGLDKARSLPKIQDHRQALEKAENSGDPELGQSNAEEDDLFHKLVDGRAMVIDPPYDLTFLALATDNNSELGQNIRAMVTNTCKFGYRLVEHEELTDENRAEHEEAIKQERRELKARLSAVHAKQSLTAIRSKAKHDKHLIGNGYLELIETPKGELVGLNHVHGHTVRLTSVDEQPVVVEVPVSVDFELKTVRMQTRFRRYVQLRCERLIWFKEAGDPRHLNKETGEYGDDVPENKRATALLHHKIYSPHTPYGVPDWIGNLFGFFGSRAAEEINFNTLNNNNVPSMFIIVENGVLTESSIVRLREFIEGLSSQNNYSKCILLEGEPLEEGSINPTNFKIRIEPVKNLQQTDELFQNFTKNANDRMRQAFRLPPIFVGRADDYTRATADTSRDIADEQVFAPDRDEDDEGFNRFVVVGGWGAVYHVLRSLNPNITDDAELIKLMGIAEKSGGMTPRRADRIVRDVFGQNIGPMPKGIDPDIPFTIQFANAQQGGQAGATQKTVDQLIDLSKRVDAELGERWAADEPAID